MYAFTGANDRSENRMPRLQASTSEDVLLPPARMGACLLNLYGALQSPDRSTTMHAAAFLQYQKRGSEGFAFSKTTSSF